MLLSRLGVELVHLHGTPDGKFPHEPEPTEKNLTGLAGEVTKHRAAVGFAQDPDADRLAIIDENGKYIGEEYSLAICARWLLSKRPGVAVTNLSTSRMLDDIAAKYNSRVVRTPVGEANVVETMLREQATVGGEGNGGVIDPRIVNGRDSLVGMAFVLQLMASTGKTLSQLVAEIPKYEIVKTKFECRREDANAFRAAWQRGNRTGALRAPEIDAVLHAERLDRRTKRLHPLPMPVSELPDCAMVRAGEESFGIAEGRPLRWSFGGYREVDTPLVDAKLITPPSMVRALMAGYRPALHESVLKRRASS